MKEGRRKSRNNLVTKLNRIIIKFLKIIKKEGETLIQIETFSELFGVTFHFCGVKCNR